MTDGVIKGTGNSRYLKTVSNAPTQYPTYESFIQALAAGTLPIDLNGINSTGWTTQGTKLNKANLLTDATAKLAGLSSSATPNTMFAKLANLATALDTGKCSVEIGSYTGAYNVEDDGYETKTITFSGKPQIVMVYENYTSSIGEHKRLLLFRGVTYLGSSFNWSSQLDTEISWDENSITIETISGSYNNGSFNDSDSTYQYAAIIQN